MRAPLPAKAGPPASPRSVAAVDSEVGQLFGELRKALGIPIPTLAAVLGTHPGTLTALETGEISRLPGWQETERVVRSYTGLAGIDPGPVLARIRLEIDRASAASHANPATPAPAPRNAPLPRPQSAPASPHATRLARRAESDDDPTGGRVPAIASKLRTRRAAAVGSAVGIILVLLMLAPLASRLPGPMRRAMQSVADVVPWTGTRVLNGMRWIDSADPRSRRSDKLPSEAR